MKELIGNTIGRKVTGITFARDNILYLIEAFLDPLLIIASLLTICYFNEGVIDSIYIIVCVILFSVTFPSSPKLGFSAIKIIVNVLVSWTVLISLLLAFVITTDFISAFNERTLYLWVIITPVVLILSTLGLRFFSDLIIKLQGPAKIAVIAGMNSQGLAIADRLTHSNYHSMNLLGFFEDRQVDRLEGQNEYPILGKLSELTNFVQENDVNTIYLSLPMARQPRIVTLLDDLKDTTASIYFVPDIFMTDLIQGRMNAVDGIPVVAVRESPFTGYDGLIKRVADFLFALIVLVLISPLLLLIAIGVKLSSSGPVIFKQRRYGLDGKEILVYKFRSMSVCEDGHNVVQATQGDQRVTKLGAFLRKSSLDELPQFINVLQGRMSVVGPRPHAISHNELYRKLIKGYMIRHKVKPGITGWAQVNGLRGETDTLEKMQARIDYDIDYLRNYSAKLDMFIVVKTIAVILKGQNSAY